jgi:hypothetical protein
MAQTTILDDFAVTKLCNEEHGQREDYYGKCHLFKMQAWRACETPTLSMEKIKFGFHRRVDE